MCWSANVTFLVEKSLFVSSQYFFWASQPTMIVLEVHQYADAPPTRVLLRPYRERPRGRAAEQRDELAAPHSITSSARASSIGGISRPRALAAARLITNSNLSASCTGRSPGFMPFRIWAI